MFGLSGYSPIRLGPLSLLAVVLGGLLLSAVLLRAAEESPAPINALCPVLPDEPIDPSITTPYKGQVVGLCCRKCLRQFKANPDAYPVAATAAHQDRQSSDAPAGIAGEHAATPSPTDEVSPSGDAEKGAGHDHSEHVHADSMVDTLIGYLGKFHVLAVHFPIALLLVAGLCELIAVWQPGPFWSHAAGANLAFGTVGAVVAAILGWLAASSGTYAGEQATILETHRWLGTSTAVLSGVCLIAWWKARSGSLWAQYTYRTLLVFAMLLLVLAAHFGGSLVYGPNYLIPPH